MINKQTGGEKKKKRREVARLPFPVLFPFPLLICLLIKSETCCKSKIDLAIRSQNADRLRSLIGCWDLRSRDWPTLAIVFYRSILWRMYVEGLLNRGGASFKKVGWTRGKIDCQKVYLMFLISFFLSNKCRPEVSGADMS